MLSRGPGVYTWDDYKSWPYPDDDGDPFDGMDGFSAGDTPDPWEEALMDLDGEPRFD